MLATVAHGANSLPWAYPAANGDGWCNTSNAVDTSPPCIQHLASQAPAAIQRCTTPETHGVITAAVIKQLGVSSAP